MTEVIFEDKNRHLVIERSRAYTPSFLALLNRTIWGSGGLQYTVSGIAEILDRIKDPDFLSLTEQGELVAVLTLSHKITQLGGKDYPAIYSYGLAVAAPKRGRGYGALLAEKALHYGLSKLGEKGIYYGYIEANNISSLKTVQKVGRKSLGQYHSLVISRFYPKDDHNVEKLPESERAKLVSLLFEQYKNHSLVDFEQAVNVEHYYIFRKGGEIVAGLQCQRKHLTIVYLPGASGLFLLKVMLYLPVLRNLLPDRNYRVLTLGNIYFKEGHEGELFNLIEALLARQRLNFGMINMDLRSPVYQRLKATGKFGIFNALVKVPVYVMARLKGFSENDMAEIQRQTLFISMLDPV